MTPNTDCRLGASVLGPGRTRFRVWAPAAARVDLHLVGPREQTVSLTPAARGYHELVVEGVGPGARYFFQLDGGPDRPDPASRRQPEGVHGPSEVVDGAFDWADQGWKGVPLGDYVMYELHVGTFSREGTFEAVIPHLEHLRDLGVTAVEIMPVAQFPGRRNWGYDGVSPFAAQNSYGGAEGLKRLVNACHGAGLAAVLDVVYNHFGPEGNYLREFGPYFTNRYHTPWGDALNFDGPESDEVRRYFIENAFTWIDEFHFDALRLDAVHAIHDLSAFPFLSELAALVRGRNKTADRPAYLIAESDQNDPRLVRDVSAGGYGLHGQWCDDFHHALHTLLTGERASYYADFGSVEDLGRIHRDGFAYAGRYSPFRRRRFGAAIPEAAGERFVFFAQNHDQVGNRPLGNRLTKQVPFDGLKLAAGAVLLSPALPLLFMGEEYGEPAPFPYFIDHGDPALVEAVRAGRRREFAEFFGSLGEPPDPFAESTFQAARLNHALRTQQPHATLLEFYRTLLQLRRGLPALRDLKREGMRSTAREAEKVFTMERGEGADAAYIILHFGDREVTTSLPLAPGAWRKRLDSAEPRWHGPGSRLPDELRSGGDVTVSLPPRSVAVYVRGEG
jgi:maltooligosyltrehalose trehalohydrolase